jgi:hypothetical protein
MVEMERFESRLAAGLGRLADEVPTAVDAAAVARSVAATAAKRSGLLARLTAGPATGGLSPIVRFGLAPVALLVLVFGLVTLSERIAPAPLEGASTGRAACQGSPWTTAPTAAVALECAIELADPRLAGSMRLVAGPATDAGRFDVRSGSLEIRAGDAAWAGTVGLRIGPNGLVVADAHLTGDGTAEGLDVDLHLVSADGLRWGVLATSGPGSSTVPGSGQ